MSSLADDFTIGVEEEFQIINPETRQLRSRATRILEQTATDAKEEVQPELYLSQIEIGTPICHTLSDVRAQITRLRREVIEAAEKENSRIAAAATHPFSLWEDQQVTPKTRYLEIADDYQQLAREQLIFGCHVHIGMSDREAAIKVMNRARLWLAPLLALCANSPFWQGVDTGYASFRTEIWRRWPMTGTPHSFASRAEYDRTVEELVATGSVSDATKIYWDIRPSARYETLEFRVADVCMTVDETVMLAGLTRALAHACHTAAVRDEEIKSVRPELLRAAKWRAARYGLDGELLNPFQMCAAPARELVEDLLSFVEESLAERGERDEVFALVQRTLARGNGAARQRGIYAQTGSLDDVVDFIVSETSRGAA